MKIGIDARLIDEKHKFGIHHLQDNIIKGLSNIDKSNSYFLLFQTLTRTCKKLPGPSQDNFKKIAVRIPNGFGCDIKDSIWTDFLLPRYIDREKIDLFHFLSTSFPKKKTKARSVVTIYDLTHKYVPSNKKTKRFFAKESFDRSITNADKIIAISESCKRDLLNFYSLKEDKIHVVHLGYNYQVAKLNESEIEELRKKYEVNYKFFLYAGWFLPHKNIERIIESFNIVKKRVCSEYKLLLVGGKGFLRKKIETLIYRLGLTDSVMIVEHCSGEKLNFLYNAAEMFLYPSLYEGFGMPILEAMTTGTPVITSNLSSCPEVAGNAALFVNPYDIEEISLRMLDILNDTALRHDLINKGLMRTGNFSWKRNAEETVKVYQNLS